MPRIKLKSKLNAIILKKTLAHLDEDIEEQKQGAAKDVKLKKTIRKGMRKR